MSDSSPIEGTKAQKPDPVKPAPKNPAQKNPAGANTGGSRLGWLVAGLVIALAAGAVGWGALYGKLPSEMRANLPAFLQAPGESAGAELDDKMAAFDAEVETALAQLQSAAANAEAQQGARLTALEGEVHSLREHNNSVALMLETLQADLQSLQNANWVSPQDLERLAMKINDMQGAMVQFDRLREMHSERVEEAFKLAQAAMDAGADAPRRTAFAVALSALDRAAATGRPFGAELTAAKAQADEDFALKLMPLTDYAPYGVDTLSTLTDQFDALARSAMKVDAVPADAPWYEKIWARLKSIITVRPVGEVPGNSTGAIISRAEAQLDRNDLAQAAATLKALEGPAATVFEKWLARAHDRLMLDAAMGDIALLAQTKSMGLVAQPAAPQEPTPPELVEEDSL